MPPSRTTTVCARSRAAICAVFSSATLRMCTFAGPGCARCDDEHPATVRSNAKESAALFIGMNLGGDYSKRLRERILVRRAPVDDRHRNVHKPQIDDELTAVVVPVVEPDR